MRAKEPWNKQRKRLGRGVGSGRGKTSTRGHKGQGARAGWSERWGYEGGSTPYYMRFPKRGFNRAFKKIFDVVGLETLSAWNEDKIDLSTYKVHGVIKRKHSGVKVLGGKLDKPITVEAHAFSKSALVQIEKAGGQAVIISGEQGIRLQSEQNPLKTDTAARRQPRKKP